MEVQTIIDRLQGLDWYEGQIETVKELPAEPSTHGDLADPLAPPLQDWLQRQDFELYSHQARAINSIREGRNVALTTPTASGKTLAFNLPVLENVAKTGGHALYIYPLKALANDQLTKLRRLCSRTGIEARPSTYDGDTPRNQRPEIRKSSRIILTNPYGLHYYLPWHQKWEKFFKDLDYVVLDEAHRYRGVFGSNVAFVLRRLRRILARYGSDPQFILSSATMANPEEFAAKLVGKKFQLVSKDGSSQGRKRFVFWNPVHHPDRSVHRQASDLFSLYVESDLQTLLFTVSRNLAELTANWSSEETQKEVSSYRAGYLPEERREIERDLRNGKLDGVVSTNALELGVDIGGLDAVIISGYPGSVISTWQQAGRAGRGEEESLVTLVAFEDPLDQYFMDHPEHLFDRSHENLVVDLKNPHITSGHLLCGASELPLSEEDGKYFPDFKKHLAVLAEENLLSETPAGYVTDRVERPVEMVSLNDISEQSIQVVNKGNLVETMNRRRAFDEAHQGAVLLHRGKKYVVGELDLEENQAQVSPKKVDYYTQTLKQKETRIVETEKSTSLGQVDLLWGRLHVEETFTGYKRKRYEEVLGKEPLDLPPIEFETKGLWFTLPSGLREEVGKSAWRGGLHGAEHSLVAMAPFHAPCDRGDIGGFSTPHQNRTGGPTIFLYDGFEGGIGIAHKLFTVFSELVRTTEEKVRDCGCQDGCPSCIYSPKCGSGNEPLDKEATIHILEWVEEQAGGKNPT